DVKQLTSSGNDSMPAFSDDGQWIYFIRISEGRGKFPSGGVGQRTWYALETPSLMRMKADGSGAERLATGRFQQGGNTWFASMRETPPSPGGKYRIIAHTHPNRA